MKHLLAATDFSDAADEALRQGGQWARELGARLVVCHVMPGGEPASHPLFPQLHAGGALAAAELRERVLEEMGRRAATLSGQPAESIVLVLEEGSPHEGIARAAEACAAELVVVGSHGTGGLRHALLGSEADRLMRRSARPVLVARPAPASGRILVATDLSDPARPALVIGAEVAARRGAELIVLHSVEVVATLRPVADEPLGLFGDGLPEETRAELVVTAEAQIQQILDALGASGRVLVKSGPPATVIVDTAVELAAELVIVGTAGRSGLGRLVLGSVAEEVAHRASCPVLAVPVGERPSPT